MEALEQGFKFLYACDLAASEGFAWDYEHADPNDLYEALEAIGYEWDGKNWKPID